MTFKKHLLRKQAVLLSDPHFPSPVTQDGISLRPFPHPYKAGVAVCNDIDNTSVELFDTIHQFLNTDQETSIGSGLNLEVGDSFWFYSNAPHVMGMAENTNREEIVRLNKAGWLDSLHTYGDFNEKPCPSREEITNTHETLTKTNIAAPVWINHGNANNKHNLWGRITPSYSGDLPGSPFYHFDLTKKLGVKYYWWSEVSQFPLSCASPAKIEFQLRKFEVLIKNSFKILTGKAQKIRNLNQPFELAMPVQLRDGNKIWGFTRYNNHPDGEWGRPSRLTLKHQLTERFLERLTRQQGYCILYTHFGQPAWTPGTPIFDKENLEALNRLANKINSGKIWLTVTSKLLRYWVTRHHLIWKVKKSGADCRIIVEKINDPVDGMREPTIQDLRGITFSTPYCQTTDIYLQNQKVAVEKWPESDSNSSHGSVGIPLTRLDTSHFYKKQRVQP